MKSKTKYFSGAELIIVDADGRLDLAQSKDAIKRIASHPDYNQFYEVLFDLRDVTCDLSVMDAYELASYMAAPDPKFPSKRKVAVVVPGGKEFDHSAFFETCARNRGLYVKSFQDLDETQAWLEGDIESKVDD